MGSRKKYEQAIADFDKAILINAKNAPAYYNKALICEKAGRKAEAI
ncbi:tetratricopeptide repeat protein [Succinispira mobilis]|nr:tetratricopeptide repeat protein [Succinispira mobilis]